MKISRLLALENFLMTTSVVLLSIFLNRGINLKPSSLGVFYQEVADSYPQIINNPVSHRPLLPFLSFLTRFDVQILNIVLLYIFTYLVYSVLRQKYSRFTSSLLLIAIGTSMVFRFTIIYGAYPDILTLLFLVTAILNIDKNKLFYSLLLLSLFTRESAIFTFPFFYLLKTQNEKIFNIKLDEISRFIFIIFVYFSFYFLLYINGYQDSYLGWDFYTSHIYESDYLRKYSNFQNYLVLGVFSTIKFNFFIFIYLFIKNKNYKFPVFILFLFSLTQMFLAGDVTRNMIFVFLAYFLLLYKTNTSINPIFISLIIFLNMIVPKYYIFEGGMVTPNSTSLEVFNLVLFFRKLIEFIALF